MDRYGYSYLDFIGTLIIITSTDKETLEMVEDALLETQINFDKDRMEIPNQLRITSHGNHYDEEKRNAGRLYWAAMTALLNNGWEPFALEDRMPHFRRKFTD